jgi:hypothetical protein
MQGREIIIICLNLTQLIISLFLYRAQLDRNAMVAGLQGRVRIEGVPNQHPPNPRPPPRDHGNIHLLNMELPMNDRIFDVNQMLGLSTRSTRLMMQIAIRKEQREMEIFRQLYPHINIDYAPLDLDYGDERKDDDDAMH